MFCLAHKQTSTEVTHNEVSHFFFFKSLKMNAVCDHLLWEPFFEHLHTLSCGSQLFSPPDYRFIFSSGQSHLPFNIYLWEQGETVWEVNNMSGGWQLSKTAVPALLSNLSCMLWLSRKTKSVWRHQTWYDLRGTPVCDYLMQHKDQIWLQSNKTLSKKACLPVIPPACGQFPVAASR